MWCSVELCHADKLKSSWVYLFIYNVWTDVEALLTLQTCVAADHEQRGSQVARFCFFYLFLSFWVNVFILSIAATVGTNDVWELDWIESDTDCDNSLSFSTCWVVFCKTVLVIIIMKKYEKWLLIHALYVGFGNGKFWTWNPNMIDVILH